MLNSFLFQCINVCFFNQCSLVSLSALPSFTTSPASLVSASLPHPPRLRQPLQPHPPQPQLVRRLRGPAGPPPAGGTGQDDSHVSVESGHRAGLAGGCHGDAHVYPHLLRKYQEWEGRIFIYLFCVHSIKFY